MLVHLLIVLEITRQPHRQRLRAMIHRKEESQRINLNGTQMKN